MLNDLIVFYAIAQLSRLFVEGVLGETVCCLTSIFALALN